jgi:transcription elongation GreA/GreB family factor
LEGELAFSIWTYMSKAFLKDADDPFDELPDRPISAHPNFVTAEGLVAIEAALAHLQQEYERVRQSNDRSPALATLSRELRYWSSRRASAQIIDRPLNPTKVEFGCSVTILRSDGRQQTYRIVGEDEADPSRGTISYVSPMAQALIGKEVGEKVRVGKSNIEIVTIT